MTRLSGKTLLDAVSEWVTECLIQLFSYFTQLLSYNLLINNNRNLHGCVTNNKTGMRSYTLLSIPKISQCLKPSSKIYIWGEKCEVEV